MQVLKAIEVPVGFFKRYGKSRILHVKQYNTSFVEATGNLRKNQTKLQSC